ncbi:MAG: YiiG family protein [Alphaproteobacteria bacterium]|nr:YiiG family protein [Alphaproteobacteria bacterium]
MKRISAALLACGLLYPIVQTVLRTAIHAENSKPEQKGERDEASQRALFSKIDAYVRCINALSGRVHKSRARYFSWANRSGPSRAESEILGLHSIDNPTRCREEVETVNDLAPHYPELETTATAYATAATRLYPILKEASSYYDQRNYKDDHMARGTAMHPLLVAGFDEFVAADRNLRHLIEPLNENRARQNLTAVENRSGRTLDFEVAALMLDASALATAIRSDPDVARITAAISQYETTFTTVAALAEVQRNSRTPDVDPLLLENAKAFLANAKVFLSRLRDKVPYTPGEQRMLDTAGGLGAFTVEGSPVRLATSYNIMIDIQNRETISPALKWIPLADPEKNP